MLLLSLPFTGCQLSNGWFTKCLHWKLIVPLVPLTSQTHWEFPLHHTSKGGLSLLEGYETNSFHVPLSLLACLVFTGHSFILQIYFNWFYDLDLPSILNSILRCPWVSSKDDDDDYCCYCYYFHCCYDYSLWLGVIQWLSSSHCCLTQSHKVRGLNPASIQCQVIMFSFWCVGLRWALWFAPIIQRHAVRTIHACEWLKRCECVYASLEMDWHPVYGVVSPAG